MKHRRPSPAQGTAPMRDVQAGANAPAMAPRRPEALPDRARWERAFQAPLGWVQAFMGGPGADEQLSGEVAVADDGRVVFRDRRPTSEVVAHEAAHLVQQRGGTPGAGAVSAGPAALEAEAQAAAAAALAGQVRPILLRAGPGPQAFSRGRLLQGRNLRQAAGVSAPSLGELPAGAIVQVLDDSGPWWRVRDAEGREGWVLARRGEGLVFADADAAPQPAEGDAPQAAPAEREAQQAQATVEASAQQRGPAPAPTLATARELAAARAVQRPIGGGLRLSGPNTLKYLKALGAPRGAIPDAVRAATSTDDPALAEAASTLRAWAGQVKTGSFLGMAVTAHNELLARLAVAEAWLERTAQAQGSTALEMFRPSEGPAGLKVMRDEVSAHGLGLAIDINYRSNPWVGGDNDRRAPAANAAFEELARHALEFSGLPAPAARRGHADALPPRQADHGQAWDQMDQLDNAIEVYFSQLGSSPRAPGGRTAAPVQRDQLSPDAAGARANIEAFLRARGLSPTTEELDLWEGRLRADLRAQSTSATSNWVAGTIGRHAPREDVGVMNLQRELVVALCDVAGLRWGASDFGEQSGDTMHFDASERVSLGGLSALSLSRRTREFR